MDFSSHATINPPACAVVERIAMDITSAFRGDSYGSSERPDAMFAEVFRKLYNRLHEGCNWTAHQLASTSDVADTADVFLVGVYELARENRAQDGSVAIIRYLDDLLHAGDFAICGRLLRDVQIQRLPLRMVLAFVTATRLVPFDLLPDKTNFIARVRERLINEIGQDRAASVLGNV